MFVIVNLTKHNHITTTTTMTTPTHIAFSYLFTTFVLSFFNMHIKTPVLLVILVFTAILPDIDTRVSLISRIPPFNFASKFITNYFPHRTITHSLLFVSTLSIMFIFVSKMALIVAFLSLFSHLLCDSLTKKGCPWFYPLNAYYVFPRDSLKRVSTGSGIEAVFALFLVIFIGISSPIREHGFKKSIRYILADKKSAMRAYVEAKSVCFADVKMTHKQTFEAVEGRMLIVSYLSEPFVFYHDNKFYSEKYYTINQIRVVETEHNQQHPIKFEGTYSDLKKFVGDNILIRAVLHTNSKDLVVNTAHQEHFKLFTDHLLIVFADKHMLHDTKFISKGYKTTLLQGTIHVQNIL